MNYDALQAMINGMPSAPAAPPSSDALGRLGKSIANLPGNIVEGLGKSAVNLLSIGKPEGASTAVDIPNFFDIKPPTSMGEAAVDMLAGKGGLADIVGQSLVPSGVIGKLGTAAGMTEGPLLEGLKWAGGFAGPELGREGATGSDAAVAAGLGFEQGLTSFLPRKMRILPTVATAAIHGLYENERHDPTTGLIAFGADVIGGMLPGAMEAHLPESPKLSANIDATPEVHGPLLQGLDDPQNIEQHSLYKEHLARLQSENAAMDAELQAYQEGGRGSLKEGVPLISGTHADQVPYEDLLASFDATHPDRMTQAGIVSRQQAWKRSEPLPQEYSLPQPYIGETVGSTFPEFATLQNAGPLEGVLPRFSREVVTDATPEPLTGSLFEMEHTAPTNPDPVFPVESFGAPRTDKQIATLQKLGGIKRPPNRRPNRYESQNKVIDPPIVPEATPAAPAVEPTPIPQSPTLPVQEIEPSFSAEHAKEMRKRYVDLSEKELRGTLTDIDDDISNTLDPQSIADYRATRSIVESVLDERTSGVPLESPKAKIEKATATKKFSTNDRVSYVDALGQEEHGTYMGKSGGRARFLADGDTEAKLIAHDKLQPSSVEKPIPEIATLQKVRQNRNIKFTEDDESALAKFLAGIPDDIVDDADPSIAGQDFNWETRTAPKNGSDDFTATVSRLPEAAIKAVDSIANAVKTTVNKSLKVKFAKGERFSPGQPASSLSTGEVLINVDHVITKLDGWHNMSPTQKARSLADVSRWIGHEAGHTILTFMSAKNPQSITKLLREFETLGETGRMAIIKDFHDMVGVKDPFITRYSSGAPFEMADNYGFHPTNDAALQFTGLHEFFAEMSAAHIFGKLKAQLLPPEMKSLWSKFRTMLKGVYNRLFKDEFDIDTIDEQLAYNNFKEIMGNLHDRFSLLTPEEYEQLSAKASKKHNATWDKITREDEQLRQRIALEDFEAATDRVIQDERHAASGYSGEFIEDPNYIPGDLDYSFATLQKKVNAAPTQMQQPIVGNKAFIQSEIVRHLGAGIGGAVAGGILGPKLSNEQMTVAEGVFMGGLLGFAGPIALRRMLLTMPKAGGSTFQHISAKEAFKQLFTLKNLDKLGGDAANGQGSAPAMFVRWLERNLNLNLPKEVFNAVVQSEGPASYAIQIAQDAFEKARTFKTTPVIDKAVDKFLSGQGTVADLRQALGVDPAAQHFGNFIVTARESVGLLQKMVASGLREGAFKSKVIASLQKGDYLTRQYRMFHDVDYKPTQLQIEALSLELNSAHPEFDLSTARAHVEDYLHRISVERSMFSGGTGDVGQKLDGALFQKKNDKLSATLRDALGEYKDPRERLMGTIRHLYTNAISSKFYDNIEGMTHNGLKMAFTNAEHGAAVSNLEARIRRPAAGTTPEQIATLQKQLQDLKYYVPLDGSARYGKLGGKMVNRFVRDQLASFDSPWGLMDGSIMRSLSTFHNYIKIGRTALNPITVVRNIMGAPILMGLSRANPVHIPEVMRAMRDMKTGLGREMLEQGIHGVDEVRGEFFRSADQILMGDYDHSGLEGIFKTGMNKVLEFYRAPDMIARGTTYLTAKKRFAQEFRLPETDRKVIDAARDWTNRYTVNYANVAPLVKTLRQVPFTNLFISYTAEITRIAKNLVEDIFTHPNAGQRVFATGAIGALAGLPFLMEKASVHALSDKDQKEWETSRAQMPDYSRSRFQVVLGKEGNRFRYLDITPLLQIDSLLQMMRSAGTNDWKGFLAINPVFGWENTPILNIVAEQISGKDLRTGRNIDQSVMSRSREVLKEIVPPLVPGGYEFDRIGEATQRDEKGNLGATNVRTGRRTTPGELVTNYLTGMRLTTIDTAYLHRNVVSDAKRQIANEASYFRDIAVTNLPANVKEKAKVRYQTAVQHILQDMHSQLQGEVP